MIFWIVLVLFVGSIIWSCLSDDWFNDAPVFAVIIMSVLFIIASAILLCCHIDTSGKVAKYTMRYESLVYQYENDVYDNDNDIGKRDLLSDIECWNSDLAWHKSMQNNFWIGIYIPDIYDQFEYIELK